MQLRLRYNKQFRELVKQNGEFLNWLYNAPQQELFTELTKSTSAFIKHLKSKYKYVGGDNIDSAIHDSFITSMHHRGKIETREHWVNYFKQILERKLIDQVRAQQTLKRKAEGLSSFDNDNNGLKDTLQDLNAIDKFEEVEWTMAITQQLNTIDTTKKRIELANKYMIITMGSTTPPTDKEICDELGCNYRTLQEVKKLLQRVFTNIQNDM